MRHYMHLPENNLDKIFYIKPSDFDIITKKSDLRYCLGATLYLPATKYIAPYLLEKRYTHLTSYAMCFENLIHEKNISIAEKTVLNTLRTLKMAEDENRIQKNDLPLFFIHVKDYIQFEEYYNTLVNEKDIMKYISGFILPKFSSKNACFYIDTMSKIRKDYPHIFALPIIENNEIISLTSRVDELIALESIISKHKEMILGIKLSGSYITSVLGTRLYESMSIYDIGISASIIYDIINSFINLSIDDISIYATSWDKKITSYHSLAKSANGFDENRIIFNHPFTHDSSIDGFIREVLLDRLNGCVGKTVFYPNQISIVNALYSVNKKEYDLACEIISDRKNINSTNDQIKNYKWAKKIMSLSRIYGVLKDNYTACDLF